MDISIVIPLYNEEESLVELSEWIDRVMKENNFSYEVFLVDDGSIDSSWDIVKDISAKNSSFKGIKFLRNYGKSAALHSGFQKVKGDVVVTMDADLQDFPDEIPELHKMIVKDGYDLVSGWKTKRKDPVLTKNIPSKFYNWTVRRISGIKLHDFNCGLKAYRFKVIRSIEIYGEMHRYIPVLAKQAGFTKITEKRVKHQERKFGETKYGLNRFVRGPLDLLSLIFITKYGKSPLHLFGTLGTLMFLIGLSMAAYLGVKKLIALSQDIEAILVTDSPYFYIALATMIIGSQMFLTGFLGELISRSSADRNVYQIEDEI